MSDKALSLSIKGGSILVTLFGMAVFVCFGQMVNTVKVEEAACPQP